MDNANLVRELEKAADALVAADRHFMHEAEMNAALHLASTVRPAPLASAISAALDSVRYVIRELGGAS